MGTLRIANVIDFYERRVVLFYWWYLVRLFGLMSLYMLHLGLSHFCKPNFPSGQKIAELNRTWRPFCDLKRDLQPQTEAASYDILLDNNVRIFLGCFGSVFQVNRGRESVSVSVCVCVHLDVNEKLPEVAWGHHDCGVQLNDVALLQRNIVIGSQPLRKESRR